MKNKESFMKGILVILLIGGLSISLVKGIKKYDNFSIARVYAQKNEMANLNDEIELKEGTVLEAKDRLKQKRIEAKDIEYETNGKVSQISDKDLEYHLPSILIQLEDNADNNKVEIEIQHGNIESFDRNIIEEEIEEEEIIETSELGDIETREDLKEELKSDRQKAKERVNAETETEDSKDIDEYSSRDIPIIGDFTTTVIPIEIKGSYDGVRGFLRELDAINFLEPITSNIASDGELVTGNIELIIIHK